MLETFYGTWLIDVIGKDAAFSQRYVINGSDRADGAYLADTTTPRLQVSGAEWTLTMEWNDNAGSDWQPSRARRSTVNFTVEDGLMVILGVDDNWIQVADQDFNDVVLHCQNIDPHLIPWHPHKRTIDFSVPKRGRDGGHPPMDRSDQRRGPIELPAPKGLVSE